MHTQATEIFTQNSIKSN